MKDVRLVLPLIEEMKIVKLTDLFPDMSCVSSPKPRLSRGCDMLFSLSEI